ncbi:MAG: toprim domain-containing protein [Candidatus Merdivicinus sp.]|jgi:ribonuclease M5
MIHCDMPIIVEGKYDKITLSNFIDGTILETGGFSIFKNKEKLEMLRVLAKKTGIIILTDSDAAGFKIRSHIRSAVRDGKIVNVYIPDVYGKERRKTAPSKEGKLGVEGLSREIIEDAFRKAGVGTTQTIPQDPITKGDLFAWGLNGTPNAMERRLTLQKKLGFPERMSANALLGAVNVLYQKEDFYQLLCGLFPDLQE